MSQKLLSDGTNEFLDQFETYLCLPILIIIVLCTANFIFNHLLEIFLSIACSFEESADNEPDIADPCEPFSRKITGMLYNTAYSLMPSESANAQTSTVLTSPLVSAREPSNIRPDPRTSTNMEEKSLSKSVAKWRI